MAADNPLIVGLGASTPIGRDVWSSAAAVRAGICGFSEHPFMVDTAGEPMRVARARWLEGEANHGAGIGVTGTQRLAALLLPALAEALAVLEPLQRQPSVRIAIALALPPPRPGQNADTSGDLSASIQHRFPGLFEPIGRFAVGHAAGHLALESALTALGERAVDAALVAGVDSYLVPETLEWLEANEQLNGAGRRSNAWGFIPGEAAGALLLTRPGDAVRLGLDPLAEVRGLGIARETKLIKTDAVCIGEGLTAAFRKALAQLAPGQLVDEVLCDMNGETYRADELGFAALRTAERFRAAGEFAAPADCWGDIGAAGLPLHTALAVVARRKAYGRGPLALVWASSESGERGALLLRTLDGTGR